ncbi:MAG: methyltransferase domain-containing protein [Pseudomonadales bacterium]
MKDSLHTILTCPKCRHAVEFSKPIQCVSCKLSFSNAEDGTPMMLLDHEIVRTDKEASPSKFRNFLRSLVPSGRFPGINIGLDIEDAIEKLLSEKPDAVIVNVGSGESNLHSKVVNLDIYNNDAVDLVADAHFIPLLDNSVDGVLCESIMEHVRQPTMIAKEFERILKPGGYVYIVAPFIFPYHESPIDCYRYTTTGLSELFPNCEVLEQGYLKGPASAYARISAAFLAVLFSFNNPWLYRIIHPVARVLLHPLSFLDYVLKGSRYSNLIGSGTFIWAKGR